VPVTAYSLPAAAVRDLKRMAPSRSPDATADEEGSRELPRTIRQGLCRSGTGRHVVTFTP
jgi:hypothetical protein